MEVIEIVDDISKLLPLRRPDHSIVSFILKTEKKTQTLCLFNIFQTKRHKLRVFSTELHVKDTTPIS